MRAFAVVLWVAAAAIVAVQWIVYFRMLLPGSQPFLISVINSFVYAGGIAASGAIVQLLADIRDRLPTEL